MASYYLQFFEFTVARCERNFLPLNCVSLITDHIISWRNGFMLISVSSSWFHVHIHFWFWGNRNFKKLSPEVKVLKTTFGVRVHIRSTKNMSDSQNSKVEKVISLFNKVDLITYGNRCSTHVFLYGVKQRDRRTSTKSTSTTGWTRLLWISDYFPFSLTSKTNSHPKVTKILYEYRLYKSLLTT